MNAAQNNSASVAGWTGDISALISALTRVVKSREDDFLTLGQTVQELFRRTGVLARDAESLSAVMTGGEMQGACSDLNQATVTLSGTCSLEDSENILGELFRKKGMISSLQTMLKDFRRIVRTLQVLGISTRIESARLGATGHGFMTLADDVENLAGDIHEHSNLILTHAEELLKLVESAEVSTRFIIAARKDCGEQMYEAIQANLISLGRINEDARAMSESTAATASRVKSSMGEVVSSLQFHDIVRQQVEHVEEVLRDVQDVLTGKTEGSSDMGQLEGWVGDVFALQSSQLRLAGKELLEAVDRLISHMRNISGDVSGLAGGLKSILAGDAEGGNTLDIIEQQVGKVIETAARSTEQGRVIQEVMAKVANTVGSMVEFVDDIEDVGSEIELIALNASVKAARTGDEGKALGVLAISIQRLSVDAREHTGKVSDLLRRLAEASELLRGNAEVTANTGENEELLSRLKNLIDSLRRVNRQTGDLFAKINSEADSLAGEIAATADGIVFQDKIRSEVDIIQAGIDAIVEQAREIAPIAGDTGRPERLRELFARYTMESERIVHQSVFGTSAQSMPERVEAVQEQAGDDEFGDNVELF